MSTIMQKYGAGVFGLLIVLLTAASAVKVFDLVTILQLLALFASTLVQMGLLKLLPGKWPGALKTVADLLGAAIALVLPYAIMHGITWQEVLVVIIGVVKAAATEFSVRIRTDQLIDARGTNIVTNIQNVNPATLVPAQSVLADPDSVIVKDGSQ